MVQENLHFIKSFHISKPGVYPGFFSCTSIYSVNMTSLQVSLKYTGKKIYKTHIDESP